MTGPEHEPAPPRAAVRSPLTAEQLRARRELARRRRARRRARGLVLAVAIPALAALAVVLIAGGGGGSGARGATGRHGVSVGHGAGAAKGQRGRRPVTFTVEASGDLLIHSPILERALALGGGRHYDFAPLFAGSGRSSAAPTSRCATSRRR